jgi:hypothetical protein
MTKILLFGPGPSHKEVMSVLNALEMRGTVLALSPVAIPEKPVAIPAKKEALFDSFVFPDDVVSSFLNFLGIDLARAVSRIKQFVTFDTFIDLKPPFLNEMTFVGGWKQRNLKNDFCSFGQQKIRKCLVQRRGRR